MDREQAILHARELVAKAHLEMHIDYVVRLTDEYLQKKTDRIVGSIGRKKQ